MKRSSRATAAATLAALALVGCSTKSDTTTTGASSGAAGTVKTGPGISGTTISLGILSDLSGVFASQGKDITDGNVLYWEQQNAKGGVCGKYQVKLDTKDTAYNVQQAIQLYGGLKADVLALQHTLGSAINTALDPQLEADKIVNVSAGWARNLTVNPENAVVGSTYDVEMINLMGYALDKGLIKDGDTVGHIYFEGEFGANGLAGSKYFASKHNLKVLESKIKATDADMSSQVTTFRAGGAKAILMSASPSQTASVASVAGLDVPILGNSPGFAPGLLNGPSAAALKARYYGGYSYVGFDKAAAVLSAYQAKNPGGSPSTNVVWGYAAGDVLRQVLDKACASGDLTREGVSAAKAQLTSIDTGGLVVPLDFSKTGASPSTQTFVAQPADGPGGLKTVTEAYSSPDLAAYVPAG
ncbi:MAG TPA: ABC transporter substrate-binding protein [Mycobacteriales bacterium]|jgi:ABC-type branched-subunit amino acid transport system substrate-binding protein|nr:ABC transporter substrate-binding protein [Mycobacteriales bacterium]